MELPKQINNINERVADDLKSRLSAQSRVSIAAASFSIYAFEALKKELEQVEELRFIFTSPTFVKDKSKKEKREFYIPKLNDNWQTFRANYKNNPVAADRLRCDILFHSDLSRDHGQSNGLDLEHINWGNYDLVVIDESHNFRNGGNIDRKNLLQEAINSIVSIKEESDIDSLFSLGETTTLRGEIKGQDDFELICFLILKNNLS